MNRPARKFAYGGAQHRIAKTAGRKSPVILADDHLALKNGRTLFPSYVVNAALSPRILVSGRNSRKTGNLIVKGRWKGFPIYTVTLEERATCPIECAQWRQCYGNNMPRARRHIHGEALEAKLEAELFAKAKLHPQGFAVRLHILGDFYSVQYVERWQAWLKDIPQLHVFGFTARDPRSPIGGAIAALLRWSDENGLRCWIRFSGTDAGSLGAMVIDRPEDSRSVICPAQTDKTDCCATCGLCWSMDRTIEFLRH